MKKGRFLAMLLAVVMTLSIFAAMPITASAQTVEMPDIGEDIEAVEKADDIALPGEEVTDAVIDDDTVGIATDDEASDDAGDAAVEGFAGTEFAPMGVHDNVNTALDLQNALQDTAPNVVINLGMQPIGYDAQIAVSGNRHVTINLNGRALTVTNGTGAGISLSGGATLTVNGPGSLSILGLGSGIHAADAGTVFTASANVGEANGAGTNGVGVRAESGAVVTISNALATGLNSTAVSASGGSVVTVNSASTTGSGNSFAVSATGADSIVIVRGDASATSSTGNGARALNGGRIYIYGNVTGGGGNDLSVGWAGTRSNTSTPNANNLIFAAPYGGYWWRGFNDEAAPSRGSNPPSYINITNSAIDRVRIEDFVKGLYSIALGRPGSQAEWDNYVNPLVEGRRTAASVISEMLFSTEMKNRNVSNEEYVRILYTAVLGRTNPTYEQMETHIEMLNRGWPRENVFAAIVMSEEFLNRCQTQQPDNYLGVLRGSYTAPADGAIRAFVWRLYHYALGREPDKTGWDGWVNLISSGTTTGAAAAAGFFFSPEMNNAIADGRTTNEDFVDKLYWALFDRDGKLNVPLFNYWVGMLNDGWPRHDVFAGFANSQEFTNVCNRFGITRGTYTPPRGGGTWAFVTRLYRECLGREPDRTGLNGWVNLLNSGAYTGREVARGFVFSREMENKNLDNGAFVDILYRAMLGRGPDANGRAGWLRLMDEGMTKAQVFNGFAGSLEFTNLCNNFGIRPR